VTKRKDGEDTERRILEEACRVFGEHGYRDATTAEICAAAHANAAAVNYHFGSKELLYRAVCAHAIQQMDELYPPDGHVPPEAPPEERLRGHIRAVLLRMRASGAAYYHRLRMMEMFQPTGIADDLWAAWFRKHGEATHTILRELFGARAPEYLIRQCQMSIMSQCFIASYGVPAGGFQPPWGQDLEDTESVIDHIAEFSMGGIRARRASLSAAKV